MLLCVHSWCQLFVVNHLVIHIAFEQVFEVVLLLQYHCFVYWRLALVVFFFKLFLQYAHMVEHLENVDVALIARPMCECAVGVVHKISVGSEAKQNVYGGQQSRVVDSMDHRRHLALVRMVEVFFRRIFMKIL